MNALDRFQGVLFAESAVSGPGGHGYYSDRDPHWFMWQDVLANTTEELLQRALVSPTVRLWHVIARGKPSGKWRYRGCYARETAYHPTHAKEFRLWTNQSLGILLRREPLSDLMDLHASLQEPLAMMHGTSFPDPGSPLTRAKFVFTQLLYATHGNFSPTDRLPYPHSVNLMVYDRQERQFTDPGFFTNLLLDEVGLAQYTRILFCDSCAPILAAFKACSRRTRFASATAALPWVSMKLP